MANTNPGGVDFNTSPYFDDYNEDKKFLRVLYVPGRAVQARELTQMQTYQQVQTRRFAEYFFKQGAIIEGLDQRLDLNLDYVKLQTTYDGTEVDVTDFKGQSFFGANTGIKAYAGIVNDIEGSDPKTLFINYQTTGGYVLTVNTAPSTLTPGNTITFSTGNTAIIQAAFIDPISAENKIIVNNPVGTLSVTTANTVNSVGTTVTVDVTAISNKTANSVFDNNETLFTANTDTRAYAQSLATRATSTVVNEGLATEQTYTKGSKITVSEGIVYLSDHFIKHDTQTIILDKYTNEPSYKIGLVPVKTFVDYIEDTSLVDNAQGTPNFQAPGANRFKIDTLITKATLTEVIDDPEFVTLSEIEEGTIRKKKFAGVESKLEDALAQRTYEESGDYTLSDPIITVREHLLQNSNGGRYTSADGGDANLLLLQVDPFTAYVSGIRNEFLTQNSINLSKGLDTEYVEQVKTQINYGQYIEVKELVGCWDFMEGTKIDLYDTAQQAVTGGAYSLTSPSGSKIGEARVRSIEYVSGTHGLADARYYIYLYEVVMSGAGVFTQVRSLYDSATPSRFADIVIAAGASGAVLKETSFNSLVFNLPYDAIKTIRDTNENVESGFRFKKKFSVTFSSGVATIATTDSSETFVGTGILSETQKNDFYMVVVNNSGADVETSALSGTVTVSSGAAAVTGSSTAFTTELNVGDIIKIAGEEIRISAIADDTNLTLESNHSAGASGVTFTKILPTGSLIPLGLYGGTGSARTVNVSSPGTVVIDLKEDATFTADVVVTMDRANAREKRKTLVYQATANVNPSTYPVADTNGAYLLGYGDVYQIHAIYQSADFSTPATTSDTNVTSSYTFDNGQRDYAYEYGRITPNAGVTPTGRLLVVFDHFTHDTTQGIAYCSVDSYPVDDTTTSNTTITTSNISTFTSPTTKETFDLRDCIDFRPIKTANTSLNPIDTETYQVPSGGLHIPIVNSDFDSDLIYYKGRVSKVYADRNGGFGINEGVAPYPGDARPATPQKLPDTIELAEIVIPPYPSQPKDVRIKLIKNRRFTMKDIGKINERVDRLEYVTALSYLERSATEKTETDADGFDRFKNGILADSFAGFSTARMDTTNFSAALDTKNKYLTCKQDNSANVYFTFDTTNSTANLNSGGKIMLPIVSEESPTELSQVYASRSIRLAEELSFNWTGEMNVYPPVDTFFETTNDPNQAIVYDDQGDADNWRALEDAWNTYVAPFTERWLGEETQGSWVGNEFQTNRRGNQVDVFRNQQVLDTKIQSLFTGSQAELDSPKTSVSGNRLVSATASLRMRSRDFIIHAKNLKDGARMYAFFDGVDVTEHCQQIELASGVTFSDLTNESFDENCFLLADVDGSGTDDWEVLADGSTDPLLVRNNEIYLLFRVPADTFYTGQREFRIVDDADNVETEITTSARQFIFATGVSSVESAITINSRPYDVSVVNSNLIRPTQKEVKGTQSVFIRTDTLPNRDPLAQSFYIDDATYPNGLFLSAIDLFFKNKSTNNNLNVTVMIRNMINGYPGKANITLNEEAVVNNADIWASDDNSGTIAATKFTFKNPVYLLPGVEYCFVVKGGADDPDYRIWAAELGAIDVVDSEAAKRIEPALLTNSGVLFTSSDDRTWTARQNLDVKFNMYIANFGTTSKTAIFKNVNVTTGFNYDSFITNFADIQLPGTTITYDIKMADSNFLPDESYTRFKNRKELIPASRKRLSTGAEETANDFKSIDILVTLTTGNQYITPYIDNDQSMINFTRNVINNSLTTVIDGTVTYGIGDTVIVGSGTDFANNVTAGEYILLGTEYRKVGSISNSTYLTVTNAMTTANATSQLAYVRNEEHPSGPYSSQSRYITRVVPLNDGFEASDLVVYLKINRPPGTGVRVYGKFLNEYDTDNFDDKFYTPLNLDGTETFTLNATQYTEEKYVIPPSVKTGGELFLNGTVSVNNVDTTVTGTSTRFLEELKIGDTLAVGTSRIERVISSIANNTSLTVDSTYAANSSSQDIYKILNDEFSYTTPDGRGYSGYKYFAVKITFISSDPYYSAKVKDLRAIALA